MGLGWNHLIARAGLPRPPTRPRVPDRDGAGAGRAGPVFIIHDSRIRHGLPSHGRVDLLSGKVDLLFGKVHAVPSRSTASAADAAMINWDMCLLCYAGAGFPDVLVVESGGPRVHDPKFNGS